MWFGTCAGEGPPVAREGWPPGYPGSWAGRPTARRSGADPRRPRPTIGRAGSVSVRPNQSRQTGVAYARAADGPGGWRHRFILDVLARKCIAYRFGALPAADVAAESPVDAVAKPGCPGPTAPARQRLPVRGQEVPKGRVRLWNRLKFVWKGHAPAERPRRVFPRLPGVHLAARLCRLPAGRGGHSGCLGEHDRARPRSASGTSRQRSFMHPGRA